MPPSPSLRCSPGRERYPRADNHKRGRSLEGGFLFREKDDNLILFNEMQTRETDNFLLDSTEDFDDSLTTKLKSLSSFKLGISVPVRGENSDLLNVDEDKNDYDWLLTPPDTPLFPSLDDETPPVNLVQRGRPRSQPISVSRSTTTEKSYRNSRGSASPQRLSPSPRSGNSMLQSRGRSSSAPYSSSSPVLRPSTPSRRPSTPPVKPSTPAQRSSTPTSRKINTGSSSSVASSGRRGASPVNTSRGNSVSPKMSAWQSNIPGFSSDAPPNLRTSLADRPASYVRGSSPASRNGRDSSSKFGRQSMSPTASRSASSSCSFDRERFSSHSKGSVASSGDDDMDSLQSTTVSILERSVTKKVGVYPSSRVLMSSKKPSRTMLSSSAPKRSFDSALRQMDRKSPQNMFRPLLSSVPSTTFYAGKANPAHRSMVSMNSSITTSSNASSEQSANVALDTEDSDHEQDNMAILRGNIYHDAQDEVFIFDKVDETDEDVGNEIYDEKSNIADHGFVRDGTSDVRLDESDQWSIESAAKTNATPVPQSLYAEGDLSDVDSLESSRTCFQCGKKFRGIELMDEHNDICPDCSGKGACMDVTAPETLPVFTQDSKIHSKMTLDDTNFHDDEPEPDTGVPEFPEASTNSCDELSQLEMNVKQTQCFHDDEPEPDTGVPEFPEASTNSCDELSQREMNVKQTQSCLTDASLAGLLVEGEKCLVDQQVVGDPTVSSSHSHGDHADQQLKSGHPSLKIDVSEGAGISLLLRRSSSSKCVVQGRPFIATNIPCEDPSYARENLNSMRNSIGHGSTSTSFSIDLSSSKHTEFRGQRQLSGRKDSMENSRHDLNTSLQSRGSSFSGISSHASQSLVLSRSTNEENIDVCFGSLEYKDLKETPLVTEEQCGVTKNTELDYRDSSFTRTAVLDRDRLDCAGSSRTMDVSVSELSSPTISIRLEEISVPAMPCHDYHTSSGNAEDLSNDSRSISDVEVPVVTPESSYVEEDTVQNSGARGVVFETYTRSSSIIISGELENGRTDSHGGSQSDCGDSPKSRSIILNEKEPPVPTISDHGHDILEETSVTIEGPKGQFTRSLTLEEATDTILFCRSIVHDLAYEAAAIGLERETEVSQDVSRPILIPSGKSSSDRKDQRGRTTTKRTPKPQKVRQKRVETEVKTPSIKSETDIKSNDSLSPHDSGVPRKLDTAKPPKLESKCNCTVM